MSYFPDDFDPQGFEMDNRDEPLRCPFDDWVIPMRRSPETSARRYLELRQEILVLHFNDKHRPS